jgi:hypothetical protein
MHFSAPLRCEQLWIRRPRSSSHRDRGGGGAALQASKLSSSGCTGLVTYSTLESLDHEPHSRICTFGTSTSTCPVAVPFLVRGPLKTLHAKS